MAGYLPSSERSAIPLPKQPDRCLLKFPENLGVLEAARLQLGSSNTSFFSSSSFTSFSSRACCLNCNTLCGCSREAVKCSRTLSAKVCCVLANGVQPVMEKMASSEHKRAAPLGFHNSFATKHALHKGSSGMLGYVACQARSQLPWQALGSGAKLFP